MTIGTQVDRSPSPEAITEANSLIRRHLRQIVGRSDATHEALCDTFAIAFRPGDRTGHFIGKTLRPAGTAVLVVLRYGRNPRNGKRTMHLTGHRTQVRPDGVVTYGVDMPSAFDFDFAMRPRQGARRRVLDPVRNPSLVRLALEMDRACERRLNSRRMPARVPTLPRIWLGFAPNDPPAFESTPALRALAARKLGVPVDRLGCNGNVLFDRLLGDLWQEQQIPADAIGNDTGLLLANAEFCTAGRRALRVFEDFASLLDAITWNPAREVTALQLDNPASAVLTGFGFDKDGPNSLDSISQEKLDTIEVAMRRELGPAAGFLSQTEVYDALAEPGKPISAWNCALTTLRNRLTPETSACCTDQDLIQAARNPRAPLIASGGFRIQVIAKASNSDEEFSPLVLDRRIECRFGRTGLPIEMLAVA